jgi:hypothetical protein
VKLTVLGSAILFYHSHISLIKTPMRWISEQPVCGVHAHKVMQAQFVSARPDGVRRGLCASLLTNWRFGETRRDETTQVPSPVRPSHRLDFCPFALPSLLSATSQQKAYLNLHHHHRSSFSLCPRLNEEPLEISHLCAVSTIISSQ